VLFYQIARYEGALRRDDEHELVEQMAALFESDRTDAEDLLAFARMVHGEINDAANSLRKLTRPIIQLCRETEKQRVLDMMDKTAQSHGAPSDQQTYLLTRTKSLLFPA